MLKIKSKKKKIDAKHEKYQPDLRKFFFLIRVTVE